MDVLLQRKENLDGVDRLDEIVGNLGSDGLVHDVLLLALRHHDDGRGRLNLLDALQSLQSRETRHHLIKKHQVKGVATALLDGIGSIADRYHLVAFLFEKDDMSFEEFYLIINPK